MASSQTDHAERLVPHIRQEGARYHVLWWTTEGTHCTVPNCEVNHRRRALSEQREAHRRYYGLWSDCRAGRDGDCTWSECPQLRDNEPYSTGRHCPLDTELTEP